MEHIKSFEGLDSSNTFDKIKNQKEFSEYLSRESRDEEWITTDVDKDDSDLYIDFIEQDIDDMKDDLESWGGWMCDDIEKYKDEPNLRIENHYLKDSDIIEIDSISFGNKLLLWRLHED